MWLIYYGDMAIKLIVINKLSKIYESSSRININAINTITVDFESSGIVFIVGKNGSGKSTLLNLIGAIDQPTSGSITVNGRNITHQKHSKREQYRRNTVSYLLSHHALLSELNIIENIELPLVIEGVLNRVERKERIEKIIKRFDLHSFCERNINELSSGQLKRISLARALVKDSPIILCDEPTENLDEESTLQTFSILKEISKEKLVIVVTHEKDLAQFFGERIIELDQGQIVHDEILVDQKSPNLVSDIKNVDKKYSLLRFLKYFSLFIQKQLLIMLLITLLFTVVFTIFGNFYALSKYDSHNAFVSTLMENGEYIIPVTEYVHTARFIENELIYYGVFPIQREPFSEINSRLSQVVKNRAIILESYYMQKNFQDFLDYHISIAPPYNFTPYISTSFTDVIIINDFNQFHLNLLYGSIPLEPNEVLIYDYMAYNLLRIETTGFSKMEDFIGYTLKDTDTQLELKISGIIKSDYEKYAYTENGNYNDYPFETLYLARLQSIYALPEFLEQFEIESTYFSFNEIKFNSDSSLSMNEANDYHKFRMINNIDSYEFIGSTFDYESGILLSKHQLASMINVNPSEINASLVNSLALDGVFRYLLIDESTDKTSRATVNVPIIGVYQSDTLNPNVLDFLHGQETDHFKVNGTTRMNYLMLGTNWIENKKLLDDLKLPYLPYSFFIDNPEYEVYGFTEYTSYSILIKDASGYVNSIKNYGQSYIYLAFGLFVLSLSAYIYSYGKKHSYKIAVMSMQGTNYLHITLIIAIHLFVSITLAFLFSILPILSRIKVFNKDLTKNLPYDVFFFSMNIFDFLIIYGVSIIILLAGVLFVSLHNRNIQPIVMMKDIL
jgi:ABC-type lipoprotein export system ATPase subunit